MRDFLATTFTMLLLCLLLFWLVSCDRLPEHIILNPATAEAEDFTVEVKSRGNRGTGFYIGNGLVMTARHVTARGGEYWIKTESGRVHPVEVLWQAEKYDVALLRIVDKKYDLRAANLRCVNPEVGEEVRAIGYPLFFGRFESKGWVASNDVRKWQMWKELIAINIAGGPGSSGGPIVDMFDNVIGMTVAGPSRNGSSLVMAVPGSTMCGLLGRS